jgi:hypothetical protein
MPITFNLGRVQFPAASGREFYLDKVCKTYGGSTNTMTTATNLTPTQSVRLLNLRSLHARPGGSGGPTSDFLVHFLNEQGVAVSKNDLSDIYWRKRPISDHLAVGIERAFALPSGWLSEDHEFLYKLGPGEIRAIRTLVALPVDVRSSIFTLVAALAPRLSD